jgi:ACT domain-containing protein
MPCRAQEWRYACGVATDETKVVLAKKLHADKSLEIDDDCKTLRISRSTFYRYVRL